MQALETEEPVKSAIARFAAAAPRSALNDETKAIETCFKGSDRDAILKSLREAQTQGWPFAAPARTAMLEKSPTSQAIGLKQMALGATASFDEALRMDYRVVSRICRGHDFYEGVRAVIVDKDNRPRWARPPSSAEVDAYFAPLGDSELKFPAPAA